MGRPLAVNVRLFGLSLALHFADKPLESLRLLGQIGNSPGGLLHGLSRFGRNCGNLLYRTVDFFAGGRLLFTGSGNGLHLIVHKLHAFKNIF